MHAAGSVKNTGVEFWNSRDVQAYKYTTGKGGIPKGWDEGLLGARVGETRRLEIPGSEAYPDRAETVPIGSWLCYVLQADGASMPTRQI